MVDEESSMIMIEDVVGVQAKLCREELRELIEDNGWCDECTVRQMERLYDLNAYGATPEDLASVIWNLNWSSPVDCMHEDIDEMADVIREKLEEHER